MYFKNLEEKELDDTIKILDDTLLILEKNKVEKENKIISRNEKDEKNEHSCDSISINSEFDKISLESNINQYKRKRNYI